MQFSLFSLILALSFLLSVITAYYALNRRMSQDGLYLYYLMVSASVWSFFGVLASMSVTVWGKIFFSKWEYFGITSAPVFYLLFTLKYTRYLPLLKKCHLILLFIVPILTVIFAFTNSYHHLMWRNVILAHNPISRVTGFYFPGPVYWINVIYCYLVIFAALFILIRASKKYPHQYSTQVKIIVFVIILPILSNALYSFRKTDFKGIDLTPVSFSVSGFLFLFGINHLGLLKVKPFARDFLFESLQDGVLFIDIKGQIIDLNQAALRIFNIHDSKKIRDHKNIRQSNVELDRICGLLPYTHTEINLSETHGLFYEVNVHELKDYFGKAVGKVIVLRDITEQKRSREIIQHQNEELEILNRQKDKVFSILSHDLRSPLSSIIGTIEMIRVQEFQLSGENMKMVLDSFMGRTKVTLELVENILQWAKLQNNGLLGQFESINLNILVCEVVRIYNFMAVDKDISLEVKADIGQQPSIVCNSQLIMTVLRNLLTNAIKFTPEGGHITVIYEYLPESFRVCVSDTGIGIGQDSLPKLFNNNKTFYTRGTRGEAGSGLGLSLCKEMIEKMGGEILLNSKETEGTSVSFTLPYKPNSFGS